MVSVVAEFQNNPSVLKVIWSVRFTFTAPLGSPYKTDLLLDAHCRMCSSALLNSWVSSILRFIAPCLGVCNEVVQVEIAFYDLCCDGIPFDFVHG